MAFLAVSCSALVSSPWWDLISFCPFSCRSVSWPSGVQKFRKFRGTSSLCLGTGFSPRAVGIHAPGEYHEATGCQAQVEHLVGLPAQMKVIAIQPVPEEYQRWRSYKLPKQCIWVSSTKLNLSCCGFGPVVPGVSHWGHGEVSLPSPQWSLLSLQSYPLLLPFNHRPNHHDYEIAIKLFFWICLPCFSPHSILCLGFGRYSSQPATNLRFGRFG